MRLSEEIRKISLHVFASGKICEFPEYFDLNCDDYTGGCEDCIASALTMLANKVEELENERSEDSVISEWVREHGDFDEVKRAMQDSDNRRVELCSALGIDTDTDWSDALVEMDKRLMPPGMEWLLEVWPKWSNGEYCKFGDWWTAKNYGEDEPKQFRKLSIYTPEQLREWEQDDGDEFGYEWDFMRPSDPKYRPDKVEQPAPAVLAADGEPLEVGQTVYTLNDDRPYTVKRLENGQFGCVYINTGGSASDLVYSPDYLIHTKPEPPDSWERLEQDMGDDMAQQQCGPVSPEVATAHAAEFVRRAKALAEKED